MSIKSKITFQPKWKEELVGTIDGEQFTIERTIGILTVYFPSQARWEASAPNWAKGKWEEVNLALKAWCKKEKTPLVVEDHAWVAFDKA